MHVSSSAIRYIPLCRSTMGENLGKSYLNHAHTLKRRIVETTKVVPSEARMYSDHRGDFADLPPFAHRWDLRLNQEAIFSEESLKQLLEDAQRLEESVTDISYGGAGFLYAIHALIEETLNDKGDALYRGSWAFLCDRTLGFHGGTALPVFFGLDTCNAALECLEKNEVSVPEKESIQLINDPYGDRLRYMGAGVITALEVYLGMRTLGDQSPDLIAHEAFEIKTVANSDPGLQEKTRFLIVGDDLEDIIPY